MNLYLISQTDNTNYDTYDSAVVCAENEHAALNIHPSGADVWWNGKKWAARDGGSFYGGDWTSPGNVSARLVGAADPSQERGVVLASFNAG